MGNILAIIFGGGFGGRPTPAPPAPAPLVPPVVFGLQPDCFQIDTSRFNICLDLQETDSNRLFQYQQAKDKWMRLISGHIRAFDSAPLLFSGATTVSGFPSQIDDLYISAFEPFIDGVGGILGRAGPEFVDGNNFPITGTMEFDRADVDIEINEGSFVSTLTHEMGHVLGIGTLWDLKGVVGGNFEYIGPQANQEWRNIGCVDQLPVDEFSGHWDERCLQEELMTPSVSIGELSIVSKITVASLQDMGYQVNLNAADPFDKRNVNNRICCFANRRNLRSDGDEDGDEEDGFEFTPLEAVLEDRAAKYAADHLRKKREKAPTDLPDGIKYVGGDKITVFVRNTDGKFHDITYDWDQVRHL